LDCGPNASKWTKIQNQRPPGTTGGFRAQTQLSSRGSDFLRLLDADAQTLFLSPYEAEAYVEGIQEFPLEEIGSSDWMNQHEGIGELDVQAHQSAGSVHVLRRRGLTF
jgi:hypothetical protein